MRQRDPVVTLGAMVEITSETPRVTGLETVIRLHRRYRGAVPPSIRKKVTEMRRMRREGLPGRRPSRTEMLDAQALQLEWDAQARRERENAQPYSGSPEEKGDRGGRNVPTAKNGSNRR